MSNHIPKLTIATDTPPTDASHALLADLLLSSQECFNCGEPAEHYIDAGEWQGKHCCTRCFESLPLQDQQE